MENTAKGGWPFILRLRWRYAQDERITCWPRVRRYGCAAGKWKFSARFEAQKLTPNVVLSTVDADISKAYVQLGLGIAILPHIAFDPQRDKDLRAIDVSHLFEPETVHLGLNRNLFYRRYVFELIEMLAPERAVVVVAPGMEPVAASVAPVPTVVQREALGTGDAVKAALPVLGGFDGDVLVLYGDTPLVGAATMQRMLDRRAAPDAPAVVVLGMRPAGPNEYGRLIAAPDGTLDAIVEWREADEAQRACVLCNSGVMAIDGTRLADLLRRLRPDNAKAEYYLTDIVALARSDGAVCAVVEGPVDELLGINSRAELAAAEAVVQQGLRAAAMAGGATLPMPETVYLCHDTRLGRDVTVGPFTVFGPGVTVADHVEIKGFCHIEGATVAAGAVVGPYARLRPGAAIGEEAHIGNFVEVKNAVVERGAKANHLSYIGDARVGAGANIGAGTITCNYDGFLKYRTDIGAGAFIGSNTALVAPVRIGDGAIVGAGSTVSRDVPADALALERSPVEERPGWAARFRQAKAREKARGRKTEG